MAMTGAQAAGQGIQLEQQHWLLSRAARLRLQLPCAQLRKTAKEEAQHSALATRPQKSPAWGLCQRLTCGAATATRDLHCSPMGFCSASWRDRQRPTTPMFQRPRWLVPFPPRPQIFSTSPSHTPAGHGGERRSDTHGRQLRPDPSQGDAGSALDPGDGTAQQLQHRLQGTQPACRWALTCECHVGLVLPQGHAHCPGHLALAPAVQLRCVGDETLLDLGVSVQLALQQERTQ